MFTDQSGIYKSVKTMKVVVLRLNQDGDRRTRELDVNMNTEVKLLLPTIEPECSKYKVQMQ